MTAHRGWSWDSPDDCRCEAVGLSQIAERLGVQRETAVRWNYRKLLPVPLWRVSRDPAWCWLHQIIPWAERTGRLEAGGTRRWKGEAYIFDKMSGQG